MSAKANIHILDGLVNQAGVILILQPEKPDTDSMTSALALEQILGDKGKEVVLYCADEIPKYLAYFEGADRVHDLFSDHFDMTILVDTGGPQMVERTLDKHKAALTKKPFVVLDHHPNRTPIGIETLEIIDPKATSTCEMVADIAAELNWGINTDAASLIVPGILADTRNLSVATTTPKNFRMVADMMDAGANIAEIHEAYRAVQSLTPDLQLLRGRLLSRMELYLDGKIALVTITPDELKQYAEQHDPSDLVIYDMQSTRGVEIAVTMREYKAADGNKIKISTRARIPVAAKACSDFGGGGHDRAAGCSIINTPIEEAKKSFLQALTKHILEYEGQHATI